MAFHLTATRGSRGTSLAKNPRTADRRTANLIRSQGAHAHHRLLTVPIALLAAARPSFAGIESTIDWVARCGALSALVGILTSAIAKLEFDLALCHTVPLFCTAEETDATQEALDAFDAELDRVLARYRALGCDSSDH